jgi:hypothetical protein
VTDADDSSSGSTAVEDGAPISMRCSPAQRARRRRRTTAALEAAKSLIAPAIPIDPARIERFGRSMREKFTSGSVPFRKAYLQSLIDVVEVDDHQIRIKGSKEVLERAVLANQVPGVPGSQ